MARGACTQDKKGPRQSSMRALHGGDGHRDCPRPARGAAARHGDPHPGHRRRRGSARLLPRGLAVGPDRLERGPAAGRPPDRAHRGRRVRGVRLLEADRPRRRQPIAARGLLPRLLRLVELALQLAEAALEVAERRLHAARPADDVLELAAELIALLLDVAQAPLEVLHGLGAPDHEVAGARVDQVEDAPRAQHEPEQQREEEADHGHGHSRSAARRSSRTTTWSAARLVRGAARRSRIRSWTLPSERDAAPSAPSSASRASRRRALSPAATSTAGRAASVLARTHLVTRSPVRSRTSRQVVSASSAKPPSAIARASAAPPATAHAIVQARAASATVVPVSRVTRCTKVAPISSTSVLASSVATISRPSGWVRTASGKRSATAAGK